MADLSRVLYGSHIRTVELSKSLNIHLINSSTKTRWLKYVKATPTIMRHKDVLLFGSRGRFFDTIFFRAMRAYGARITYDVADLPHLQNFYFWGGAIDERLARRFHSLVNLAEILIFVSPSAPNLSEPHALRDKKTIIVPNASNPDFFVPIPRRQKTKIILYVGGYAVARGVDDLVAAFNVVKKTRADVRLRLVGVNMLSTFVSERVSVEKDKTYRDMPKVYGESYACIIPHRRNPYMDAALPVKLFDTMAAARPVIVTDCVEVKRLVEEEKCGLVARTNPDSLAEAIGYLVENPLIAQEMGVRGRKAVLDRHSWKHRAQTIKEGLRNLEP